MACYHPFFMIPRIQVEDFNTGESKRVYDFAGHYVPEKHDIYPDGIKVPCGKCLGCKLDYSRSWADRMTLELDAYTGDALFVTLTYNNSFVPYAFDPKYPDEPQSFSLRKDELQKFFKRLRKEYNNIRYYACGEYGKKTKRPHYHAIIFGLNLEDFPDRVQVGVNELGQAYFTSEKFSDFWAKYDRHNKVFKHFGYVCLSEVSYKTCAYVSRYCAKKVVGNSFAPSFYAEDEFALMSRNPGIGFTYLVNRPDCLDLVKVFVSDGSGSCEIRIPKYFYSRMKLDNPEKFDKMVEERKRYAFDREFFKLQSTDLSFVEQMEMEENELLNRTQILFNREEVVQ